MNILVVSTIFLVLSTSCIQESTIEVSGLDRENFRSAKEKEKRVSVTSVEIVDNQLVLSGENLLNAGKWQRPLENLSDSLSHTFKNEFQGFLIKQRIKLLFLNI